MEMVLQYPSSSHYSSNLTNHSHIGTTIQNLTKKLSLRQLSMFRKTIFGYLLDVDLVFNGPLIHHHLLREVESSKADVITMYLFEKRVPFGRSEFDIISGLKYSRTPNTKHTSCARLRQLYFEDKKDLTLVDLENVYRTLQFEGDYDAVKVSIVYLVELVLLGRKRRLKFDTSLLGIVDDWKVCCNHDWGTMMFEKTIKSLRHALTKKAKDGSLRKSYSLYGFPWAF